MPKCQDCETQKTACDNGCKKCPCKGCNPNIPKDTPFKEVKCWMRSLSSDLPRLKFKAIIKRKEKVE